MRVTNDDDDADGPFDELVRLQADFQARLAEETMRYLRRLQSAVGPAVPGTVIVPDPATRLSAAGVAGGEVVLEVEVANSQGVHCIVTPAVSPFLSQAGATWYPAAELEPATALVGPGEMATLRVTVALPDDLPAGEWHGALLLHGFRGAGITTTITVADDRHEAGGGEEQVEGADGGGTPVEVRGGAAPPAHDADRGGDDGGGDAGRRGDAGHRGDDGPGGDGPGTPLEVRGGAAPPPAGTDVPSRSTGRPGGGPVRPRIAHGAPPRGRREQLVLPAVPPDLAERLGDGP